MICANCLKNKPTEDNFYWNRLKARWSARCKECYKEYASRRNKEKSRKQVRASHKKRAEFIRKLKDKPCMDCGGVFHYCVMDFDHRPGVEKDRNISQMWQKVSKKRIAVEASKCDVVCANCHRLRTWIRANGAPAS